MAIDAVIGQWLDAGAELTVALQPPLAHEVALQRTARTVLPLTRACAVVAGTIAEDGAVAAVATRRPADDPPARRALRTLTEILPRPFVDPIDLEIEDFHVVAVPLRSALTGRGAVAAFYRDPAGLPDRSERKLFLGFGQQAGLALDRIRAVDDRASLAVVTDRERIARDLHDVVIQRLFATGLQLQALGRLTDDPVVAERVAAAVDALDLTIKDVRGSIFDLHHRHSGSLRDQVRAIVGEYAGALGFTPVLRTTGPVDTAVPEPVRAHLLPVVREAVSNLARHAQATSAEIELAVAGGALVLFVRDDGVGLPDKPGGLEESGLRNVRDRAAQLGGTFTLRSRRSGGTAFRWTVRLTES